VKLFPANNFFSADIPFMSTLLIAGMAFKNQPAISVSQRKTNFWLGTRRQSAPLFGAIPVGYKSSTGILKQIFGTAMRRAARCVDVSYEGIMKVIPFLKQIFWPGELCYCMVLTCGARIARTSNWLFLKRNFWRGGAQSCVVLYA